MTPARRSLFTLASNLGMTVHQLMHAMPVSEVLEWYEYHKPQAEAGIDLANASADQLQGMFGG
jgi:hypothetical protein